MQVKLANLKWRPFWASYVGALKGCLDFLDIRMSECWLSGGIGHAFVLNINKNVSAAGPTAWNTEMIRLLGHNLGSNVNSISAWKNEPQFEAKQRLAWETAKRSLDRGLPCFGWDLGMAEYYVINGYNQYGYYYSGIGTADYLFDLEHDRKQDLETGIFSSKFRQELLLRGLAFSTNVQIDMRFGCWIIKDVEDGREFSVLEHKTGRLMLHGEYNISQAFKPWDELGRSTIGLLELYTVESAYMSDDTAIVKEALEFALEFGQSPRKWVKEGFYSGLQGYEMWRYALDNGCADGFGAAYNASFWHECRRLAAQFLLEASERIGGEKAIELCESAKWYEEVSQELKFVAEKFPFHQREPEHIRNGDALVQASLALGRAQSAEQQGVEKIRGLVNKL